MVFSSWVCHPHALLIILPQPQVSRTQSPGWPPLVALWEEFLIKEESRCEDLAGKELGRAVEFSVETRLARKRKLSEVQFNVPVSLSIYTDICI